MALANRIVGLEQENARLRMEVETLSTRIRSLEIVGGEWTICHVAPPIDAHVLELDHQRNGLVLDKGSCDGVKAGYDFHVFGKTYKGQVRVTEVDDSTALAEIRMQKNPIAPGDSATTQL